jgi:hypothetical protein
MSKDRNAYTKKRLLKNRDSKRQEQRRQQFLRTWQPQAQSTEYVLLVEQNGEFSIYGRGSYGEVKAVKESIENDYSKTVIVEDTPGELAAYGL